MKDIIKLPQIKNTKGTNKFSGNFHVTRTAKTIV